MNSKIVKSIVGCFIYLIPILLLAQPSTTDKNKYLDKGFPPREILIIIDGPISNSFKKEFDSTLSTITINFKKEHESGVVTIDQKILHRNNISDPEAYRFIYSNLNDKNVDDWLTYQYHITWKYQEGIEIKQDWRTNKHSVIILTVPHDRKKIYLEGILENVWGKSVKTIIVEFSHDFFGQKMTRKQVIQKGDSLVDKQFEITFPLRKYEGTYKVIWLTDEEPITWTGTDKYGLIFIDRVPKK